MPLVVGGDVETAVAKTKAAVALLKALGASPDADRCADSKKLRAGKGKMRNRRYVSRVGPLVVYSEQDVAIAKAVRNIPGCDLCHVDRLNLLLLAPGGHVGRFIIWTGAAFAKLDALYGAGAGEIAALKKDYCIPRSMMTNPDLARIINSDEVQSVVRPVKVDTQRPKAPKKNPLKNLGAMLKLNPYHEVHRASEMRAAAARATAKANNVAAKRNKYVKAADHVARKAASKAFHAKASIEGEVQF